MGIKLSTVSVDVTLADLGARTFVHPTVDYDLTGDDEFTISEIYSSDDMSNALIAGTITLKDEYGFSIKYLPVYGNTLTQVVGDGSGFRRVDVPKATIAVDDATRTFSITPVSADFDFYIKGQRHVKTTAPSIVFDDNEGVHHFIFDADGNLLHTDDINVWIAAVLGEGATVSFIVWDKVNQKCIFLAEERHGMMMGEAHAWMHLYFGMQWESGGALYDVDAGASGDNDTDAQFGITTTECADEDLRFLFSNLNPQTINNPAQLPVYYRVGTNWRKKDSDDFPIVWSDGVNWTGPNSRCAYNDMTGGVGSLQEVNDADFFLTHIFTSNEYNQPLIVVLGQDQYTTRFAARVGANIELHNLVTAGLNIAEFRELATVIWQTDNGSYTNTPHARIVETDEGDPYIDWRYNARQGGGGGGITSHGNLLNLEADDHQQYQLVEQRTTTEGDIPVQSATGLNRLPVGALDQVLGSDGVRPVWVDGGATTVSTYLLENFKIGGAENQAAISVGMGYRSLVIPELNVKITQLAVSCISFGGNGTYNVGVYDSGNVLLRSTTLEVTAEGLNLSTVFTELEMIAKTKYWFAVTPTGVGASSYLATHVTATGDSIAQQLNLTPSPYDLPDPWTPETGATTTFWMAGIGTVSISGSAPVAPTGPQDILNLSHDIDSIAIVGVAEYILPFNVEYEKDASFEHSTTVDNTVVTIAETGAYLLGGTCRIYSTEARYQGQLELWVDQGAGYGEWQVSINSYIRNLAPSVDYWDNILSPLPHNFNAGDKIQLRFRMVSTDGTATAVLVADGTSLWATRLEGTVGPQGPAGVVGDSDLVLNDHFISGVKYIGFNSEVDNGNSGASKAIDFSTGQKQAVTLNATAVELNMTFPAVGNYVLKLIQDATVPATGLIIYVTGGGSVLYPSGDMAVTATASSWTIVTIYYDGSNAVCSSIPDVKAGSITVS